MVATANYSYQSLGDNEIRLLKILSTSDLQFEITHHNLDQSLDYAALSYTWGEPVFRQVINLYDYALPVTDNLHDALQSLKVRQMQKKDARTRSKYIWVDQICINQDDIKEKNSQIPLMKRIYEQASKVIVWLGNPENPAQIALGVQMMDEIYKKSWHKVLMSIPSLFLKAFLQRSETMSNEFAFTILSGISIEDSTIFDIEGSPAHEAWLGICALFRSPWWTRTWVYQEATIPETRLKLSSKDTEVTFLCGLSSTTWARLRFALSVGIHLQTSRPLQTDFM